LNPEAQRKMTARAIPAQEPANLRTLEQTSGVAACLAAVGIVGQLIFGVYRTGRLWMANAILRLPPRCSIWGFTFGAAALGADSLRFVERGATGPIAMLAPYLFAAANLVIGGIALGTLWLPIHGRLLPPPLLAATAPTPAPAH
jgi:tellurite resistance protein